MPNILGREINIGRAFGKSKARSQMCLIRTSDGRLVHREVPAQLECAIDEDIISGFLIDTANQYQDEKSGDWYQIIDENSTIPICLLNKCRIESKEEDRQDGPRKRSQMEELLAGIFHHSWTMALATMDRDAARDRQRDWLYLIAGVPIILCCLILAMNLL